MPEFSQFSDWATGRSSIYTTGKNVLFSTGPRLGQRPAQPTISRTEQGLSAGKRGRKGRCAFNIASNSTMCGVKTALPGISRWRDAK